MIVVAGVLLIVFLLGGFFYRYMLMQFRATRRQGNTSMVTTIAYSLAMLAKQKIQNDILQDPSHRLTENLFQPLEFMEDIEQESFRLDGGTHDLTSLANKLFSPLSDAGEFSYELKYSCVKCDYASLGAPEYCCQKEGLIHIWVEVTLRKADYTVISEDVNVAVNVKVTAAHIPLLSKFNLFVQDAETAEDSRRFNLVWTDPSGRLNPASPGRPWVLQNASEELLSIPRSFSAFVDEPRGWVYLGGNRVCLNIARGWGGQVELSEGFHLFFHGNRAGLYTTSWEGPARRTAIMAWDQGICHEIEAAGARDWWDFIKDYPSARQDLTVARANSVFRLFGAGSRPSPTLVLGEVYRGVISARAYKKLLDSPPHLSDFLDWIGDSDAWRAVSTLPPAASDTPNIGTFSQDVGLTSDAAGLAAYQARYASKVGIQPFNISLGFIQFFREANPLPNFDEEFQNRMTATTPLEVFFDIPRRFRISEIESLRETPIEEIIQRNLLVPGPRTGITINSGLEGGDGGSASILSRLKEHGLISRNSASNGWDWNLNGWVYVDCPDGQSLNLELDSPSKILSNGGLVLKRGSITVGAPIVSDSEKVLQLVTLGGGDIIISTEGEVHAGLTAVEGSVKTTQHRARIFGCAAMHHFDISSASQGADLNYNPLLSIAPTFGGGVQPTSDCPEKPLLAARLADQPVLLR
jgi:hypothetical protein